MARGVAGNVRRLKYVRMERIRSGQRLMIITAPTPANTLCIYKAVDMILRDHFHLDSCHCNVKSTHKMQSVREHIELFYLYFFYKKCIYLYLFVL